MAPGSLGEGSGTWWHPCQFPACCLLLRASHRARQPLQCLAHLADVTAEAQSCWLPPPHCTGSKGRGSKFPPVPGHHPGGCRRAGKHQAACWQGLGRGALPVWQPGAHLQSTDNWFLEKRAREPPPRSENASCGLINSNYKRN